MNVASIRVFSYLFVLWAVGTVPAVAQSLFPPSALAYVEYDGRQGSSVETPPRIFRGEPFDELSDDVIDLVRDTLGFGLVWTPAERVYLTRRNDGRVTTALLQSVNGASFSTQSRIRYEYGAGDAAELIQIDAWDSGASAWQEQVRFHVAYSHGAVSEILFERKDAMSTWVNEARYRYQYTVSSITREVDRVGSGGSWVLAARTTDTYDFLGQIVRRLDEASSTIGGPLVSNQRKSYTWMSIGRLMEVLTEVPGGSGGWLRSRRTDISYPSEGRINQVHWSWNGSEWILAGRNLDIYQDGYIAERLEFEAQNGSFQPKSRLRHLNAPIPVELVRFEAVVDGGDVVLLWETASEVDNAGFSIERRVVDNFESIGFVEGHGTTSESVKYRFVDGGLADVSGLVAYRLRQVDTDGGYTLSKVLSVQVDGGEPVGFVSLGPNPMRGDTNVQFRVPKSASVQVALYNVLGQRVAFLLDGSVGAGRHSVTVPVRDLANGTYFLRLSTPYGQDTASLVIMR